MSADVKFQAITNYVITSHARWELSRRSLSEDAIRAILTAPEQAFELRPGRMLFQSKVSLGQPGKTFLIRVFVDIDRAPAEVVTAYMTSKIAKYWRASP